jgi:DNA-directed RNA polymerase I subunit RPA2
MPDAERTRRKPTFNTLAREEAFRSPPKDGSTYSILNEFVAPHIESFNALFDDSGLPSGDGDGRGLISLGLEDIGERVVFDGDGKVDNRGWGNRMRSEAQVLMTFWVLISCSMDRVRQHCPSNGA